MYTALYTYELGDDLGFLSRFFDNVARYCFRIMVNLDMDGTNARQDLFYLSKTARIYVCDYDMLSSYVIGGKQRCNADRKSAANH